MSRYTFTRCCLFVGALITVLTASGVAMGDTLLFGDNFNSATAYTDMNTGIAGRTSGTYASATYVNQGGTIYVGEATTYPVWTAGGDVYGQHPTTVNHDCLRMSQGDGWGTFGRANISQDFGGANSVGGQDISFRAKVSSESYVTGEGIVISIGGSDTASTPWYGATAGISIYLRYMYAANTGNQNIGDIGLVLENGTDETPTTVPIWSSDPECNATFHDFRLRVTGVGDNNPFDGVGQVNVKLYVDGGATAVLDYTSVESGATWAHNYVGLMASGYNYGAIDSLSISQVPEPSSLVLLAAGLAGLLAYAWRKRK